MDGEVCPAIETLRLGISGRFLGISGHLQLELHGMLGKRQRFRNPLAWSCSDAEYRSLPLSGPPSQTSRRSVPGFWRTSQRNKTTQPGRLRGFVRPRKGPRKCLRANRSLIWHPKRQVAPVGPPDAWRGPVPAGGQIDAAQALPGAWVFPTNDKCPTTTFWILERWFVGIFPPVFWGMGGSRGIMGQPLGQIFVSMTILLTRFRRAPPCPRGRSRVSIDQLALGSELLLSAHVSIKGQRDSICLASLGTAQSNQGSSRSPESRCWVEAACRVLHGNLCPDFRWISQVRVIMAAVLLYLWI